jgi:3-methylcrotonyl-CoA carboxylase beta subunit
MDILVSTIETTDSYFQANAEYHRRLAEELRQRLAQVRPGSGPKYQKRLKAQGKLFVHARIDQLLDPGSPLLEFPPLIAWGMYNHQAPGAGIVTGIGRVAE